MNPGNDRLGHLGLFPLGAICATPGAIEALRLAGVEPIDILTRHVSLEAGELCEENQRRNRLAVEHELRVLSSYRIGTGLAQTKVWCITESDRAVTTIFAPGGVLKCEASE